MTSVKLADECPGTDLVKLRLTGRGAVRVGRRSLRFAAGTVARSSQHQAKGQRTFARGAGMVSGAWGHVYSEYKRPEPSRDPELGGGPTSAGTAVALREQVRPARSDRMASPGQSGTSPRRTPRGAGCRSDRLAVRAAARSVMASSTGRAAPPWSGSPE